MVSTIITSERSILLDYLESSKDFPTDVRTVPGFGSHPNPISEEVLGQYRPFDRRKVVTADLDVIMRLISTGKPLPGFLEAGPRARLAFDYRGKPVKAAVVTTGGLAPGLNSVIHAIAERHLDTYGLFAGNKGGLWGFLDSFKGMAGTKANAIKLDVDMTETWLEKGGSELCAVRYEESDLPAMARRIAENLERWEYDILYIIGGDGSMRAANHIAVAAKRLIVVGIPKTMDNDLLWVWQSFGHNTAVARAASFVNTIHNEAKATHRVCLLQFFGANSGFVAANATLASGHVDLVMIPEVFEGMDNIQAEAALEQYVNYLQRILTSPMQNPHAIVVLAEGVGRLLERCHARLSGVAITQEDFPNQLRQCFKTRLRNEANESVDTIVIEPRHSIRAVPANAHDQIYCRRLGALAVDNALAGYTSFMISQWLTEYVLVPLDLVCQGQKRIPVGGMFWKQVVACTGQPMIESHNVLSSTV